MLATAVVTTFSGPVARARAVEAVEQARAHGIRVGCFRPPSTPDGSSRLRLTAHADHAELDLDRACEVLAELTGPRG